MARPQAWVPAYLDRLGLEAEPPSVDALIRLHQRHVERVPYETLWIHLGENWDIDPRRSAQRIATTDRGGYCYQLNGALSQLLRALGYRITRHVGAVHGPAGVMEDEVGNHLVLLAHGLETDDNTGGTWYVDVGLGDAMYEPLPLAPGAYTQGPFHLEVERIDSSHWHLVHDRAGSFSGMRWRATRTGMAAFSEHHRRLSTSPDSGFVQILIAQRRDATGADILRGLTFRRIGRGAHDTVVGTKADLTAVLGDCFGLDLGPRPASEVELLWNRLHKRHLAWEAAGRPRRL